jgi:GNAT superfamily N-acetyltransferase
VTALEIVRDDDPRCAELEQAGYWGARLRDPDRALLDAAVLRVASTGVIVRELGPEYAEALFELENANVGDYPYTPATERVLRDLASIEALWTDGGRVFGALDGDRLVGATVMQPREELTETAFTSVLSDYRGRGIGQAIKAASILAFLATGSTVFATGGAGQNDASLGANRALGYTIEERWRSYSR